MPYPFNQNNKIDHVNDKKALEMFAFDGDDEPDETPEYTGFIIDNLSKADWVISIKLGESALCPNCAHIDDDNDSIIDKIKNFKCCQCSIPIDRLKQSYPTAYKIFMGGYENERD